MRGLGMAMVGVMLASSACVDTPLMAAMPGVIVVGTGAAMEGFGASETDSQSRTALQWSGGITIGFGIAIAIVSVLAQADRPTKLRR